MKKKMAFALALILVFGIAVGGTIAYLTDKDEVINTFAVGAIDIALDEAPVDNAGKEKEGDRVKANTYLLLPGGEYDKDPTVHVTAKSENSWIYVKVENGIAAIEAADNTIAAQIAARGWTPLKGVTGVYYKSYTKSPTVVDMVVFETFTIDESVTNTTIDAYKTATIKITAYAMQQAGFETDPVGAWNTAKFA